MRNVSFHVKLTTAHLSLCNHFKCVKMCSVYERFIFTHKTLTQVNVIVLYCSKRTLENYVHQKPFVSKTRQEFKLGWVALGSVRFWTGIRSSMQERRRERERISKIFPVKNMTEGVCLSWVLGITWIRTQFFEKILDRRKIFQKPFLMRIWQEEFELDWVGLGFNDNLHENKVLCNDPW